MKKYLLSFCICSVFLLAVSSCWKKDYKDVTIPSEWLLPLVKGRINPLKLTTIKDKHTVFEIIAEALDIPSDQAISSPIPLSFEHVGTFEVVTNELIQSVQLNTCYIDFNIINNFPTAILAGTA